MAIVHVAVPAQPESWDAVIGLANQLAVDSSLAETDRARLVVCLDELFTNSLGHGRLAEHDGTIRIDLGADAADVTVVWQDDAPAFDPLAWLRDNGPPAGHPPDRVGGAGLVLIAGLTRDMAYDRRDGCNRLTLVLRRSDAP